MSAWPRLQHLAETTSITANPAELIPTLVNRENARQTAPLAAFFTLVKNAITYYAN